VCSLFWFNRVPALDVWAVYFLGSYFLGMLLHWVLSGAMNGRALTLYFWFIAEFRGDFPTVVQRRNLAFRV
jgi:hypothetical protein